MAILKESLAADRASHHSQMCSPVHPTGAVGTGQNAIQGASRSLARHHFCHLHHLTHKPPSAVDWVLVGSGVDVSSWLSLGSKRAMQLV